MRIVNLVVSILVFTLSLTSSAKEIEVTIPLQENENIEIVAKYGTFSVSGWAQNVVNISGQANEDIRVQRENSTIVLSLNDAKPSSANDKLVIKVPADRKLSVTSNNADFSFDGLNPRVVNASDQSKPQADKFDSDVSIASVDGDVNLKNSSGDFNISTVNGDIAIVNSRGVANIRSVSGKQIVNADFRNVISSNVSGESSYKLRTLENLSMTNVNGNSSVESVVSQGASIRMQSVKGDVELRVPESTSARFSLQSYQGGSVANKFEDDINVDTATEAAQVFSMADASATVNIDTMSGNIVVAPQNVTSDEYADEGYDWSSVDTSILNFAFVNPNYDVFDYQEIYIKPPEIHFDPAWLRKHGNAATKPYRKRVAQEYADLISKAIADKFSENGQFKLVDHRTENVLVIIPKVLELYINNPEEVGLKEMLIARPAGNARLDLVIFSPNDNAILALFMDKRSTAKSKGIATFKVRTINSRSFSNLFNDWTVDMWRALEK